MPGHDPHYLQIQMPELAAQKESNNDLVVSLVTAREQLDGIFQQVKPEGWLENDFRQLVGTLSEAADLAVKTDERSQQAHVPLLNDVIGFIGPLVTGLSEILADQKVKDSLSWLDVGSTGVTERLTQILQHGRMSLARLKEHATPEQDERIDAILDPDTSSKQVA